MQMIVGKKINMGQYVKFMFSDRFFKTDVMTKVMSVRELDNGDYIVGTVDYSCFGIEKMLKLNELSAYMDTSGYEYYQCDKCFEEIKKLDDPKLEEGKVIFSSRYNQERFKNMNGYGIYPINVVDTLLEKILGKKVSKNKQWRLDKNELTLKVHELITSIVNDIGSSDCLIEYGMKSPEYTSKPQFIIVIVDKESIMNPCSKIDDYENYLLVFTLDQDFNFKYHHLTLGPNSGYMNEKLFDEYTCVYSKFSKTLSQSPNRVNFR